MSSMEDQAEKFRNQKKHNGLLMVAATRGYQADVEALVELGAALDCRDKKGHTPMHFAAANGRTDVVRFLWSRGAEVEVESPEGRTPLHMAALGGHGEVAALLLQKGAWADAYDAEDNTPLHLAARHGHTRVLEVLVQHGAKAGAENKQGLTAAACALVGGHVAAAKLLQGWGASISVRPHGYSLLHLAAGMGSVASVGHLLEGGADPNDRNNPEGATPLHSAALGGCSRCAKALLEAGADRGLPDNQGRLPADLAQAGDPRLAELLHVDASAKAAAKARSGGAEGPLSPPKPAQEQFVELAQADRLSKVERWALLDSADLAAALRQYPPAAAAEATARIGQLAATRKLLNIHKALAALHADEDFQGDAQQPQVREAIDAIRADTSRYERYAADPQILAVLQKMRMLHSVAQANGQRTVDIDSMLAQPGWEKRDAERQLALQAACSAHLAAAAAAAATPPDAGSPADAAQAAYDAAFNEAQDAARGVDKASGAAGPAGGAAGSTLRRRAAAGTAGAGGAKRAAGEDAAAAQEIEERERKPGEEDELPEWMRGGFTWKKVWQEFLRQTRASLLMLALFLLAAWVVRGRPPWVP